MIGKKVRGALYVHRSALPLLTSTYLRLVEEAEAVASGEGWNVVRIETDVVAFLTYQSFDEAAFPALLRSTKVALKTKLVSSSDFTRSSNPLILHRKELLVNPEDPRVPRWTEMTSKLVDLGLFQNSHLIGRLAAWNDCLREKGLRVAGDDIIPV